MPLITKKKIGVFASAWLVLYIVFLCSFGNFKGIFLTSVLYDLDRLGTPSSEFVNYEYVPHKYRNHTGRFIGEVAKNGVIFSHLQFDNLLLPENRILEVFVPKFDSKEKLIIQETNEKIVSSENAYLIDQCFCGDCCPCNADQSIYIIRTNGLGSNDYYHSFYNKKTNKISGTYNTAKIPINWIKRNRMIYWLTTTKLLYSIPLDIILLPAQPYLYAMLSV